MRFATQPHFLSPIMAVGETCRLNGSSKVVMKRDERTPSHRSLLMSGQIASAKRKIRSGAYIAVCFFFFLLIPANALAQGDYESHLADAVSAQSAGNIPAAITAYQSALAIWRSSAAKKLAPRRLASIRERIVAFKDIGPFALLITIILG